MAVVAIPSLERIIRDVRIRLNQPKAENSRWSDTELTEYINEAIQQMFLVVNEICEGQFDAATTLNTTSGTETVALPTDCFAVKVLYYKQGTLNRRLEYRQDVTSDYQNTTSTSGEANYEPYYFIRGTNLVLRPIPGFTSTSGPLVLEYTRYPDVLVYGGDLMTSGISPLFKQVVVAYAVTEAKRKDDLVTGGNSRTAAESHLSDLWTNFRHQVSERSKAPQYIRPYAPY
jgi:hypothetical protein